ncbi:hypothetical protein I5H03_gp019 [Mycobacterium phage Nibb]|uniref:AAA-ATPase n=1 Tax=Mycobacterium phage Nibb TaxID=2510585 RepID=A0A411B5L7_9CAUD|nr:hypothetical protein I5H03_gp019 [Mycobacterium phage Nibb]QAX95627.1 hypothetical protein SEA_NIBB_88 [Mycobacterium phage Nibb]
MPSVLTLQGDRQHGKTTALLDMAFANARRGQSVAFWSPSARESEEAARMAFGLTVGDRSVSRVSGGVGGAAVEFGNGGRVVFVWGYWGQRQPAEYDVEVHDDTEGRIVRPRAEVRNVRR